MDIKNIIAAISLSALVLILYSLFFAPPPPDLNEQKNKIENTKNNSAISSPKIEKKVETKAISRDSALDLSERIKIENNNIIGSISLKGAIIDDLIFKKYTTELNSNQNVILLNPTSMEEGYFVESGWSSTDKNIELPNNSSIWTARGNNKLTPNNPVVLEWINKQGIIFTNTYQLDEKYLPKIYKIVAPSAKLNTANRVPIHFPNINPANKPIGIPKPSNNTQKIVQINFSI